MSDRGALTTWTEQIKRRLAGDEPAVPWWVNDKYKLHMFCQEHELPMPKLHRAWRSVDDIDFVGLPDRFVLKPSVMHSSWGVMLLRKLGDGDRYAEALTGRTLTEEAIRREQAAVYERCKYKSEYRILVEEEIEGAQSPAEVVLDYKVFCFYDTVALIQQINRNESPKRFAWFDERFEPIDLEASITSDWSHISEGGHVVPPFASELVDLASRATRALRTPFMSVDMFAAPQGPVIGEMTPAPGAAYYGDWYRFTPEFNERLGSLWESVAARINAS